MARESPRLQRGASSPRRPVSSGLVEGFGAAGGAHVAAGDAGAVAGTLAAEAVAPAVARLPLALAMLLTRKVSFLNDVVSEKRELILSDLLTCVKIRIW